MYHALVVRTGSHLARVLRPASRLQQHVRFCTAKRSTPDSDKVLYEEYETPEGGKYRLDYNAQNTFSTEDWKAFERIFELDTAPSDEEIDKWVEENSEDWEVVQLPAHSNDADDTAKAEAEAHEQFDEFDEFEKPVRSVRELRQLGKLNNRKEGDKKKAQAMRALRLSKQMELAAVRALNGDGGGSEGGLEICRATLSDNLRDLTVVFRSDADDTEKHFDEMAKKVKSQIAASMRTKFIPKVWFKRADEEDQKRLELQRLFERIARETA